MKEIKSTLGLCFIGALTIILLVAVISLPIVCTWAIFDKGWVWLAIGSVSILLIIVFQIILDKIIKRMGK